MLKRTDRRSQIFGGHSRPEFPRNFPMQPYSGSSRFEGWNLLGQKAARDTCKHIT